MRSVTSDDEDFRILAGHSPETSESGGTGRVSGGRRGLFDRGEKPVTGMRWAEVSAGSM
jgi:hypothetical protein